MTGILHAMITTAGTAFVVQATSSDLLMVSHKLGIPTIRLNSYEDLMGVDGNSPSHRRLLGETGPSELSLLRVTNRQAWLTCIEQLRPDVTIVDAFPAGPLDSLGVCPRDGTSVLIQGAFVHGNYVKDLEDSARRFNLVVAPWPDSLRDVYPGTVDTNPLFTGFATFPADRVTPNSDVLGALLDGPPPALINVGGSSSPWAREFIANAVRVLTQAGYRPVIPSPLLRSFDDWSPPPSGALSLPLWPIASYLPAFRLVVTTAGMNSFPEIVRSGVPAVFAAKSGTAHSDQVGILHAVQELGLGPVIELESRLLPSHIAAADGVAVDQSILEAFSQNGANILAETLKGMS